MCRDRQISRSFIGRRLLALFRIAASWKNMGVGTDMNQEMYTANQILWRLFEGSTV